MCVFLRNLAGAIALMYLPASGIAATITRNCIPVCDPSPSGANANDVVSTPIDVIVYARALGGVSNDFVSSSIRYEATLQITFEGGTGAGVYIPGIYAGANKIRTS